MDPSLERVSIGHCNRKSRGCSAISLRSVRTLSISCNASLEPMREHRVDFWILHHKFTRGPAHFSLPPLLWRLSTLSRLGMYLCRGHLQPK